MTARLALGALLAVGACAAKTPPPVVGEQPTPMPAPPTEAAEPAASAAPAATCTAFVRPGVLRRSTIVRAVDGGLGRWLSGVDVEPSIEKKRFRGWIVRRLHPEDPCYALVDVRPGDLVLRVNGRSIERPEQANEIFQGLRSASALAVDLLRAGEPRRIVFSISE